MTYFKLLKERFDKFLELETQFFGEFYRQKKQLYRYRFRSFGLGQWGKQFVGTVVFSFNYGLLRLSIYGVSLGFRLFFLPFRLAVELYLPYPRLRKLLFFFFSFFETVGGIVGLRNWFLYSMHEFTQHLIEKGNAKQEALFQRGEQNNPIERFVDGIASLDERYDRFEFKLRRGLIQRLFRYGIHRQIPAAYRLLRRWIMLRYRYLRFRSRRFRKGRLRKKYAIYLKEVWLTQILEIRWQHGVFLGQATVDQAGDYGSLFKRFLCNLLAALLGKGPPLGRRYRYPSSERSQRYRWSRFYRDRTISGSSFGKDHDKDK